MKPLESNNVLCKNWKNIKHQLKTVMLMENHEHSYRWQQLPCDTDKSFPALRNKHAVCISNGALYVFGGRDKSIVHSDLWRYHLDSGQWERPLCKGDKPRLLQEHTLTAYKNKLYIFGGQFASGTESETPLWILDLESLTWRKQSTDSEVMTPAGRRGHSVVTNGNQMVVYGGYLDMRGSTSELWLFDMDSEMWHLAYSILNEGGPGGRHGHSAVTHANSMWVVGGMRDLMALCDMWKWDFSVRRWSRVQCKNSPPEVHGHSACVLYGDMILVGGESQWILQDTVWQFNFKNLTWQKLKFDGQGPSSRSHHACVAVPSFLLKSSNDHSITQSEPNLQPNTNGNVHKTIRPNTSPANTNMSQDGGTHLFKNKVNPTLVRHNRSTYSENTTNTQSNNNTVDDVLIEKSGSPNIVRLTGFDQGDSNSDEQQILSNMIREDVQRLELNTNEANSTDDCSSDVQHLLDGRLPVSALENLRQQLPIDCVYRTESGGFENPLFSRESSIDYLELPSPRKRLRYSADNLESSSARSVSAETVQTASNRSNVESLRYHIPGVVKSGSLDSLLTGLGGVKITYIQIDNEPASSDNNVVLEDIEDSDLLQLERSHDDYASASPTHRFSMSASGQFESSRDQLLNAESDDFIQMSDFNHATNTPTHNSLNDEDLKKLTLDFMVMDDHNERRGPSFELTAMDVPLLPQNQRKTDSVRIADLNRTPSQRFTPGLRETVADVNDHPNGITMILCGGKEANRTTCDLQPMPMWRLDGVKT